MKAAAAVLRASEQQLTGLDAQPELGRLEQAQAGMVRALVQRASGLAAAPDDQELESQLQRTFRIRAITFTAAQIAGYARTASGGAPRPPVRRALRELVAEDLSGRSVWLRNSIRGAAGLAVAVFIAQRAGLQHSFWVVLGTLSVLRSNALNTGQNVLRGLLGTVAGFVVGAGILAVIGTNATLLWLLLPIAIFLAGSAPAVISFAAGQAGFTLVLVILFNIVQPAGWRVGLLRVEDIALGCAVSLLVGALFWPRGAAGALGVALTEAYGDSAGYLASAVAYGLGGPDGAIAARQPPTTEAARSAAAARRLDDAFRSYLAERGAKPVPLAEITALVTGVVGLRLAGDAVLDLWREEDGGGGEGPQAGRELLVTTTTVVGWYRDLAASLTGRAPVPAHLPRDQSADQRLVDAVRHDLLGKSGRAGAAAVRMIWTGDHLDAARRLQATLVGPAQAATERGALAPVGAIRGLGAWRARRT
jgi:hypothetical protein